MNKLKIGDITTVVMAASMQLVLHIVCVPSTCMEGCTYCEFEEGTGFVQGTVRDLLLEEEMYGGFPENVPLYCRCRREGRSV